MVSGKCKLLELLVKVVKYKFTCFCNRFTRLLMNPEIASKQPFGNNQRLGQGWAEIAYGGPHEVMRCEGSFGLTPTEKTLVKRCWAGGESFLRGCWRSSL